MLHSDAIPSTALIPYTSSSQSANSIRNLLERIQDYVFKKSFTAQLADYRYLCGPKRTNRIWSLPAPITQKALEGIAKLLCPEKSMILRPFERDREAVPIPSTRPTPCGLGEEKGFKWPQKGDFNGQSSFAIPSLDWAISYMHSLASIQTPSKKIERLLSQQVALINTSPLIDLQRRSGEITDLFFRTLSQCDYDRSLISPRSSLESILDPTIYQAHDRADSIDQITGRRIYETVAEALFARRLGVKPEKADSPFHSVY